MERTKLILVVAVYVAVLLWAYATVISPVFAYNGYNLSWPQPLEFATILALTIAPTAFLPTKLSRPSILIAWWMYVTVYIPSILVPVLSLSMSPAQLMPLQTSLLLAMIGLVAVSRANTLILPRVRVAPIVFWTVVLLLWSGGFVFVAAHFSLSALLVNLASLFLGGSEYTIRTEFFEQLSQSGRILGYVTGQIGEAIDPFFIAYGLAYRRWPLLILGAVGQLMMFAVAGEKSILFSTLFLVLMYFMWEKFRKHFGIALVTTLTTVIVLSAIVDTGAEGIFASSVTTRRTLIDPGLLTGFYHEHYSETARAGIGYHFFQPGTASLAPSYEIGLVYFGDEHIDANANLWAEGYADFGYAGIGLFTLVLGGMMWMYDSVAARTHSELAVLVIAMQAFSFSNSAPLTTLITHGGLACALLLWCAPSRERADEAMEKWTGETSFSLA